MQIKTSAFSALFLLAAFATIAVPLLSTEQRAAASPTYEYSTAANPDSTIVKDGNGNWLATFTKNARTVTLRGPERALVERSDGLHDSFPRIGTGGWGIADKAGYWYESGGSPSDYSTDGNLGNMLATSDGVARRATINNTVRDIDATVKLKTDKLAAGADQIPGMMFGYQDSDNHYLASVRLKPGLIDGFDRMASNGWGGQSSAFPWTRSGGSLANYSVSNAGGVHSVDTTNSSRRTVLSTVQTADFNVAVKVKTSALAAGGSQIAAILGRYQDSNNHYIFRARFTSLSSRDIYASIQKNSGGTVTTMGNEITTPYDHTANSYVWIRAQATGSNLRMRVWPDGMNEPSVWQVSLADSTFANPGSIGLRSILAPDNTNALPVHFTYDNFQASFPGLSADSAELNLQVRQNGTYTPIGTPVVVGAVRGINDWLRLRVQHESNGTIRVHAWKDGEAEPVTWQMQTTDTTFVSGRVGLRSISNSGTSNLPVKFSYDELHTTGSWPANPTVQHNVWVRLLPQPFNGTVDEAWLQNALNDTSPDALAIAMQYIAGAPATVDELTGLLTTGDASYGPLLEAGSRAEGSDFNDYLGVAWQYGDYVDNPEPGQLRSLDCSGFIRMVFGYRMGIKLRLTTMDGVSLPRVSSDIAADGPGVILAQSAEQLTALDALSPGDIVAFDADTTNSNEQPGQIDHIGIYLGVDTDGKHRFVSARKTLDGPTFADIGGRSTIGDGTNLYTTSLRLIRRF